MVRVLVQRVIAAALLAAVAGAAHAAAAPSYILNGYSLSGLWGVDTASLEKKLKHKEGDRITEADVRADRDIVVNELKAEHVRGQVVTSLASKKGHVWVIFDLLDGDHSPVTMGPRRILTSQKFEGVSHIPVKTLDADTGLKIGDVITPAKITAAHDAILADYAKAMPGKKVAVKAKMQVTPDMKATLTWIVGEPK